MPGTAVSTLLALIAFAANSVLCRQALRHGAIDPATFSAVRLASGAAMLALLVGLRRGDRAGVRPSWYSAGFLFLYAVPFSFAYVTLGTGTGALLLFGAVQLTMIGGALRGGDRLRPLHWVGLVLAIGGLVYLLLPGVTRPSLTGAGLMALAGFAWGVYSLRGRATRDPLGQSASNFLRATPFALLVALPFFRWGSVRASGVGLAALSGAVASGLGYVIWYRALPGLPRLSASIVQLAVPVLAAAAGVALLGEPLSARLLVAGLLVLGGIAIVLVTPAAGRGLEP